MATLCVQQRLCLNDMAIPLVAGPPLAVTDPLGLLDEDLEEITVSLVSFKATGSMQWLQAGLSLPSKWWVCNHHRVPLCGEILESIKHLKPKGAKRLLPRSNKDLVAIRVRGKILLVQNEPRSVTLGLRAGKEQDELLWFLQELQKDVEALHAGDSDSSHKYKRSKLEVPEEDDGTLADEVLAEVRAHPLCKVALWLPSRNTIRVVLRNGGQSEFTVKDLKKKRQQALEHDDLAGVRQAFSLAAQSALEHLRALAEPPQPVLQNLEERALAEPSQQALQNLEEPEESQSSQRD